MRCGFEPMLPCRAQEQVLNQTFQPEDGKLHFAHQTTRNAYVHKRLSMLASGCANPNGTAPITITSVYLCPLGHIQDAHVLSTRQVVQGEGQEAFMSLPFPYKGSQRGSE